MADSIKCPQCGKILASEVVVANARRIVEEQALDEALWLVEPATILEVYLREELRRLHAAVEGDAEADDPAMKNLREAVIFADRTTHAGFVVWDEKYHLTYRGKVYDSEMKAEEVRQGIAWHSRDRYKVRRIEIAVSQT